MSYPLERPLPDVAVVRAQITLIEDVALRELLVQLCNTIDYLNAKIHAVADAAAVPLEE